MLKQIVSTLSVLFTTISIAQNTIVIPNVTGNVGDTLQVSVEINNADAFVGFQLDIEFPSAVSVITDSTRLTSRSQDHSLAKSFVSENRYRFLAYSLNNQEFLGSSGAVLRIFCDATGDEGNYAIVIHNPVIGDINSQNVLSGFDNGTLTLIQATVSVDFVFPQAGWYIISLPVIPSDSSVTTLFPSAVNGKAFHWHPVTEVYEAVLKIEPKKGYWIAIPEAITSVVNGIPLYEYTEHFSQGWHMIGSVNSEVDFTNPNDQPDGSVLIPAFGYDNEQNTYVSRSSLIPKEGVWIAVMQECDLTVGGGY